MLLKILFNLKVQHVGFAGVQLAFEDLAAISFLFKDIRELVVKSVYKGSLELTSTNIGRKFVQLFSKS